MSIDLDLTDTAGSSNPPPDRTTSLLVALLAVLLCVAAVIVLLTVRQRSQQAALLKPSPTATARAVASPTATRPATGAATPAPTAPPTPTRSPVVPLPLTATPQPTSAPPTPTLPSTAVVMPTPQPVDTGGRTWYFGEGASVSPFRTTYAIFNPGSQAAAVTLTLFPEDARSVARSITVAPSSQSTLIANDVLSSSVFGASISSDRPVYVERITVGDRDGTTSSGLTPSTIWYFPEGQTGDDFTTWLLILNPGSMPADVTVKYYTVVGTKPIVKRYTAPASARLTVAVHKDIAAGVMGIIVEASRPIVAEYAIYFDDQKAAHGGPGIPSLSKTWYIGAGNTQVGFTARLAILNPNKQEAEVKVTFLGSKQQPITDTYPIAAEGKDDIVLNDRADEQLVAAIIESNMPIAVEVITYYLSGGERGQVAAYSAPALPAASKQWYLPALAADSSFDSYLSLLNPGQTPASVTITYVLGGGQAAMETRALPALGRLVQRVGDIVKDKTVVAASVSSTQPIVAERITMFRSTVGATSSAGIVGP